MEGLKNRWHWYLAALFFILGLFFLGRGHAYENPHALKHIYLFYGNALAFDDCKTFAQKIAFHKENGERCMQDAKDRCWWLPNINDRKKARYCWMNTGALIYPNDPRSKLIALCVSTLIQYGIDCNDEWDYINTKLYWSQYHFEMAEFYEDVIRNGLGV